MNFPESRIFQIAQVVNEATRVWLHAHSDRTYPTWDKAPDAQKKKMIDQVTYHIQYPLAGDAGIHNAWLKAREAAGWKWGKVKSQEHQTDPGMVPFHILPPEHQARDRLVAAIVRALVRV